MGGEDLWLIKTDSSGNEVWNKTFGGVKDDEGHSVRRTSDGGYIVTGNTNTDLVSHSDVWLVKTDASGNKLWDRTFSESSYDEGNSVQQTSDGGYIVLGSTYTNGTDLMDVWLVRTGASGNKVWSKTLGGTDEDQGNSVQQTTDGGYIITGTTYSYGAGGADVWLIKTDADGN